MSDKRLSPQAQEKLAQQLRERLSRRRQRPLPWMLVSLAFVALVLSGLWFASGLSRRPLPPLMLTCFDELKDQWAEAQLVAPSEPDANLEGLEIHWKVRAQNKTLEAATTKTDRAGVARYRIAAAPAAGEGERELHVSFVDPAGGYRRDCRISLRESQ